MINTIFRSQKNFEIKTESFVKSLPNKIFGKLADIFSIATNLALSSFTWIYDGFAMAANELELTPTKFTTGITAGLFKNVNNSIDHLFSAKGQLSDYFTKAKYGKNPLTNSFSIKNL